MSLLIDRVTDDGFTQDLFLCAQSGDLLAQGGLCKSQEEADALLDRFKDDIPMLDHISATLEPANSNLRSPFPDSSPPIAQASCVESPVTGGCSPGGGTVPGGEDALHPTPKE